MCSSVLISTKLQELDFPYFTMQRLDFSSFKIQELNFSSFDIKGPGLLAEFKGYFEAHELLIVIADK